MRHPSLLVPAHKTPSLSNTLATTKYTTKQPPTIQSLFLHTQPCPASRAAWPPCTTAPTPAVLPPSILRNVFVSGEQLMGSPSSSGSIRPVTGSMRCCAIQSQFSLSSSGHSALNLTPPSPALMFPTPLVVGWTPGTGLEADPPPVEFHHLDLAEYHLRSAVVPLMLPAVISSLFINDMSPIKMVDTDQAGLNDFGWKSLMLRHSLVDG